MSTLTVPPRVSIDELVRELHAVPASAFDTTEQILSLLAKMPVAEDSLAPYLSWNRQHYTRNLIDKTDLYELVAICWEVGQSSSVHNHRDQNCWMAAPVGRLLVENFHVEFQDLEAGKCRLLASNTVELTAANPCAVDPREPVHRVVNPREAQQRAVTLHVYSRPFDTCVVYSPEQGTCGDIRLHYNTVFGKPVPLTRGEVEKTPQKTPQNKREIHYALDCRDGSVWLVKRPDEESLMPGMWELPQVPGNTDGQSWLTLRHSITVTDYVVRVRQGPAPNRAAGKWVAKSRLAALPLTGLTQKILRAAAVI